MCRLEQFPQRIFRDELRYLESDGGCATTQGRHLNDTTAGHHPQLFKNSTEEKCNGRSSNRNALSELKPCVSTKTRTRRRDTREQNTFAKASYMTTRSLYCSIGVSLMLIVQGSCYLAQLRVYPVKFARTVTDLFPRLVDTAFTFPDPPAPLPSALESFLSFKEDDPHQWPYAKLAEVYSYLRRSKRLQIPAQWEPFIPNSI